MKDILIKILVAVAYIAMIIVNFLANSLPINNRSTGEISDAYPNLFTPAGPAFSIWSLIYFLLGGYVLCQFIKILKKDQKREELFGKINPFFIASSFANVAWIFAWHYDYIGLSVCVMAILLILLAKIADIVRVEKFATVEKFFIPAPFSLYFGWITVATIANITVFLVSVGWNRFGVADFIWTSIILLIGVTIGIWRMRKDNNIIYGAVFIWAYLWILFKHLSVSGFDGQYPSVIATVIVCLALFAFFFGKIFIEKINYEKANQT